jgi:hypothetical protein
MKNFARPLVGCLVAAALVPSIATAARVYKSKGPDGSTVFSDQPSPQAHEVDIDVPAPAAPPTPVTTEPSESSSRSAPEPAAATVAYQTLRITAPTNDAVFWFADGPVKVQTEIDPPLAKGDVLVPYLNGAPQGKGVAGSGFALTDLDPDTYELAVAIRDANGRELKRSETVRFHYRRQSLNLPARKPPPKGGG